MFFLGAALKYSAMNRAAVFIAAAFSTACFLFWYSRVSKRSNESTSVDSLSAVFPGVPLHVLEASILLAGEIESRVSSRFSTSSKVVVDIMDPERAKFFITVVSPDFKAKSLLQRHRMVNTAAGMNTKEMQTRVHALEIKAEIA